MLAKLIIWGSVFGSLGAIAVMPSSVAWILPKISPVATSALFATIQSPGSKAIAVAEGNLTQSGAKTPYYLGHLDPGNQATNKGFCSWNKASGLSVDDADKKCLSTLQVQSATIEKSLVNSGLDPVVHQLALINGTDVANQSGWAGANFVAKYRESLAKGLKGEKALLAARVESFRNGSGSLDASGLFGICASDGRYRQKLSTWKYGSESWRWNCIALDQGRRVKEITQALHLASK